MAGSTHVLMVVLLLADLVILGSRTLRTAIAVAAVQGVALGLIALAANADNLSVHIALIALLSIAVKGVTFPLLLRHAVRGVRSKREDITFVGPSTSIIAGVVMFGVALWLSEQFPVGGAGSIPLVLPGALFTMFAGLFLIVARRTALMQCVGYVVFENGIYAFGVAVVGEFHLLLEMGMLLDAFVAVLVMGVAIRRIGREFDHIDVAQLDSLRG